MLWVFAAILFCRVYFVLIVCLCILITVYLQISRIIECTHYTGFPKCKLRDFIGNFIYSKSMMDLNI